MMLPRSGGRLVQPAARFLVTRNAASSPAVRVVSRAHMSVLAARRSYATTTRATKPTATVKKAVKQTATAKTPAPKKKAAPAKKPVKKPAARKPAAKRAAPKKPVKRVKKELTPEEKAKADIRALRAKALKEPTNLRALSAYNIFVAEKVTNTKATLTEVSKDFKALSPAQIEHYNHLAAQKTAAKREEYTAWVRSHTPDQIRIANNARNQLRKKLAARKGRPAYTEKLIDDRRVRPPNAYNIFFIERYATGDMKGIKVTEAAKLIASEWKVLSEAEKKKYQDDQNARRAQAAA